MVRKFQIVELVKLVAETSRIYHSEPKTARKTVNSALNNQLDTLVELSKAVNEKYHDFENDPEIQSAYSALKGYENDIELSLLALENLTNDLANVQGFLSATMDDLVFGDDSDHGNLWSAIYRQNPIVE